jgi:ArsR family transcriptional regulator
MTDARAGLLVIAPASGRNPGLVERVVELNGALSDQTRVKLIKVLGSAPAQTVSVSDAARTLGISQPAATKQLKVLYNAGFVRPKRVGQSVFYSINRETVEEDRQLLDLAFAHAYTPCVNEFDCDTCPYRTTCI